MTSLWCADGSGRVISYDTAEGVGGLLKRHVLRERERGVWCFESTREGCEGVAVALETVLDESRGVSAPFLVSHRPGDPSELLEVFSLGPQNSETLVSHGVLRAQLTSTCGLEVLDGPTIIWGQGNTVFIARQNTRDFSSFHQQEIHVNELISGTGGESGWDIERLWCFTAPDDSLLVFLRCCSSTTQEDEPTVVAQWLSLSLSSGGRGGEDMGVQLLPSHCLLPSDYGCIATCITVHTVWGVGREEGGGLSVGREGGGGLSVGREGGRGLSVGREEGGGLSVGREGGGGLSVGREGGGLSVGREDGGGLSVGREEGGGGGLSVGREDGGGLSVGREEGGGGGLSVGREGGGGLSVGREGGRGLSADLELMVGTRYGQVVLLRGGIPIHCVAMESTPNKLVVLQVRSLIQDMGND